MAETLPLSLTDIYDIISCNLFASNIESADERMEAAKLILNAFGAERTMRAPKDGVLLHFSRSPGDTKLVILTDPPIGGKAAIKQCLDKLSDTLGDMRA